MARKRIRELTSDLSTLGAGGYKFAVDPPTGSAAQVADTVIRDFMLEDTYSTEEVDTAIEQAIANVTGGQTAEGLVTGGIVAWESDYIYRVSAATYYIAGELYSSTEQTVELDAADGSNDRIDVLALDDTGTFVKVTGTAAAQPSNPPIDPGAQLQLAIVLVTASTTEPPTAGDEDIFLENTEWTSATSGSGFNPASTNSPNTGSVCLEGTTVTAGSYAGFTRGSTIDSDDYDLVTFFIRSKGNWNRNRGLNLQFYSSGSPVGVAVPFKTSTWGYDSSSTSAFQFIAIPLSQFIIAGGTSIDGFRLTDFGGSIGFYIDDIKLKASGGSGVITPTSGITQDQADNRYVQLTGANVTDEAYGAGWNGSTAPPTKNAVYDKIETVVAAGATRASLGLDTTDSPEFLALNIGAASDTTLARSGAGDLTVEGNAIYRAGGTDVPVADGGTGASTAAAARLNLLVNRLTWDFNFTDDADAYVLAPTAMTVTEQATTGTGTIAYEKSTAAAPNTFGSTTSPITLEAGAKLKVSASSITGTFAVHLERTA